VRIVTQTCLNAVIRRLRGIVTSTGPAGLTDALLVERFVRCRDEAAFEVLLWRHGPMVLATCARLLARSEDVEDAFQATFLTLLRKASAIHKRESVGCWLYKVAYRVALEVRATEVRRTECAKRAARFPFAEPGSDPACGTVRGELCRAVDEEVNRLPEKYRAPVVLCYLEGKTHEEAARELGWAKGTVSTRLTRARTLLQPRLARRGFALAAGGLVAGWGKNAATAAVPADLARSTLRAAFGIPAAGTVSAKVALLVEGAAKTVGATRGAVGAFLLVLSVLGAGAGALAFQILADKPVETNQTGMSQPKARDADQPIAEKEGAVQRTDYYGDPLPPGVLARMGTVQLRHRSAHVTFSADGKTLISAGSDLAVRFWDVAMGKLVRHKQLWGPKLPESGPGSSLEALSPDGKVLAALGGEWAYLYDANTGEESKRLPTGRASHRQFVFAPDGKTLATAIGLGGRSTIRLWDVARGKERTPAQQKSYVGSVAFSPNGKLLASSVRENGTQELCLWDTTTGQEVRKAPTDGWNLAFSPDGKTVASGNRYGTVTLWEAATLKEQATLKPAAASWTSSGLTFSWDGKWLAVAGDQDVVLWEVVARKERCRLPMRKAQSLAFAPDGKTLACAGQFEICLWDFATGERLHNRPGHDSSAWSVTVSPDGKLVASASWDDPAIRLWDASTGKPLRAFREDAWIRSCEFSADGKLLLSAGAHSLRLWETATGTELRRFDVEAPKGGEVLVSHLSPDGKCLAAIRTIPDSKQNRERCQLHVWDALTGKLLTNRPFRGFLDSRFTPDGGAVTVQTGQGLTLEETMTGRGRTTIPGNLGRPVAFAPDGKLVAVGIHKPAGDSLGGYQLTGMRVAEVATGEEVFHVEGWIDFAAFSPDGRLVATADPEALRLWDASTGQRLFRRPWPEGLAPGSLCTPISSLTLLPGGRALATGMGDGTILVWDLAPQKWPAGRTGRELNREELDGLWSDLLGEARKAQRAIPTLAAAPRQTVPFLRDHVRPATSADPKHVGKLLADLDSERFAAREEAAQELAQLGERIEPLLRRALEERPSAEVRKRIEELLDRAHAPPAGEVLRTLRAIQVLERIGTAEARAVLEQLAKGAAAARATREATEVLGRWHSRPSGSP
jgi:RNA polymerase sigma factor (sigma-70 family)